MISQYLGALVVGGAFLAIGMATSAYIASAVGAFLLGAAISFALILVGLNFIVLMIPGQIGRIVAEMTIYPHLTNLSRGVIDVRDLLYFGTIMGIALALTVLKLAQRKVAESKAEKRKLVVIMVLILAVGVVSNVLMYQYPIRLDATASRQFSLSPGTKKLLRELPDRVTVTLYTSANLPGPMQATLRETGDRLKDFSRFSDKLAVKTVVVDPASEKANEARQKGIREVQFNQYGAGSFAVQTGFLGLNLQYGNKSEVIDFVDDATGLEYQLSRLMLKLTREQKPAVGLVMDTAGFNYQNLNKFLNNQYEVRSISDSSTDKDFADLKSIIVLDDGSGKSGTVSAKITDYLTNNGNGLFLIAGVNVDQQSQSLEAVPSTSSYLTILEPYGIRVNPDLVYDTQNSEAISMGQGNTRYVMNYPFWVKALLEQKNVPWKSGINSAVLGWPSSITINNKEGVSVKPLLSTSKEANTQTENFTIAPQNLKELPPPSGTVYTLGVTAEKGSQRLGMIGNTTFTTDDFLQNSQENGFLVANLIDWVTADPILMSIPQKSGGRTLFVFSSPRQIQIVQYGAIIAPAVIVMVFGFWWLNRRKRRTQRVYGKE